MNEAISHTSWAANFSLRLLVSEVNLSINLCCEEDQVK